VKIIGVQDNAPQSIVILCHLAMAAKSFYMDAVL
jgi:hypothetical protein